MRKSIHINQWSTAIEMAAEWLTSVGAIVGCVYSSHSPWCLMILRVVGRTCSHALHSSRGSLCGMPVHNIPYIQPMLRCYGYAQA